METHFFAYLAKVNAALILFYLLYAVVFRRDTFIRLRRYYLLSAIVFSLVYPFFSVNALSELYTFPQHRQTVEATVVLGEPTMTVLEEDANDFSVPWKNIGIAALALGTLFFAARLVWQLISILKIRRGSPREIISGYAIYQVNAPITPFSFFGWIFIHANAHSEEELRQILLHEGTHARQWHSADVMLIELLCVLFWWNPAVWLMKREITINLEYLADNDVLQHGISSKEYQYHLLKLTYRETAVQIVNNFNVSQLKQRIMMMNKSKSPTQKLARYLSVLPLALLLITLNSCLNKEKKTDETTVTEEPVPVAENAQAPAADTAQVVKDEVFVVVEEQPLFPGGNPALMKFLGDNIKYPVIAQENGISGRVITNFVVEKDGSITDVQVVRGVDPSLDKEALRVIQSMPKWKPGRQRGEDVRVRYTLPVVFRLEGGTKRSSTPPPPPPPPPPTTSKAKESASKELFVVVEKQPRFPGGNNALMKFLGDNVKYPTEAQRNGVQGRVICNFVVEKDGSITDVQVVRGVDPKLDAEAIRLIESMPKWEPGKQRGETVRVRFMLPVVFRLQK